MRVRRPDRRPGASLRHARADGERRDTDRAVDRAAPLLRFFRHGDGGLALFNGGREGDPQWLDTLLTQADAKGRAPASAPQEPR